MSDINLLASVPIFSNLSLTVIKNLRLRMDKRSYHKDNMILMQDEFGDTFFAITRGSVKINRIKEDGKEVIFAFLNDGDFFGEMSLLDEEPRSANVFALSETEVLILQRSEFLAFLEQHPDVALSLLTELVQRIRRSDEQIESLSLSDAEHRIGMTLLRLAEEFGIIYKGKIEISDLPYRKDIASMAGTSKETVSRTMKIFEEHNLIEQGRRHLSILDYSHFKLMFCKAHRSLRQLKSPDNSNQSPGKK